MGRLLKKAAEMELETAAGRKRKAYSSGESESLKTRRLADDDGLASCCSSNYGSSELASNFVDLELDYYDAIVQDSLDCEERRETPPLKELESTPEKNPRRGSATVKMPSEADLEEFFSAAEKSIHQKFINKYNFDIVKDEPLQGRYEWVELKLTTHNLSLSLS